MEDVLWERLESGSIELKGLGYDSAAGLKQLKKLLIKGGDFLRHKLGKDFDFGAGEELETQNEQRLLAICEKSSLDVLGGVAPEKDKTKKRQL